jgi:spore photoproduct lyase
LKLSGKKIKAHNQRKLTLKPSYCSKPPIETILVDQTVKDLPFVKNIQKKIKSLEEYKRTKWIEISDYKTIAQKYNQIKLEEAKKILLIYPEKGQYMHACPGSDGVICCRYFVLDFGMNCPYDCHYCYLQTYAKIPYMTIAGNIEELLDHLQKKIMSSSNIHWRIGTGEYMDSLALENITGMGALLVDVFSRLPNATLELKTKSVEIRSLLNLHHNGNTVLSWSLNPDYIIENVEIHCSTLDQRLQAAKKAIDAGYQTGFHFDPVILYENWESDYLELIDRLFATIPASSIRWISLGTFRYSSGLKEKLRARYPDEFITRGELLPGEGNKYRYIAPQRNMVYQMIWSKIKEHDPDMMIYLCMETKSAWKRLNNSDIIGPSLLDRQFESRRLFLQNQLAH